MKNYISILTFLILALGATAQEVDDKREAKRKEKHERKASRMEAKKIAYITEELEMTSEEAQKFWPIYNEFQGEIKKLKEETRKKGRSDRNFSDADAEVFLNGIFEKEQKQLDLKKRYFKKMETALPKSKVAKLYTIEHRFRDKLYKSIKRKMKEREKSEGEK